MSYTGTHEPLFIPFADPNSLFEKEASISRMPDDDKRWPAHIISEIHKQIPELSSLDVDIDLTSKDAEAGYAFGHCMIRNRSVRNVPQEEVGKVANRLRIPVIVEDRQLQPFHTFELGGNVYPLTAERLKEAMVNPHIVDGTANHVPRSPSTVDQMYPPYQQRQGFGRIAEPNTPGLTGIGKSASAPEGYLDQLGLEGLARLDRLAGKTAAASDAPNYRAGGETSCAGCKFFQGDGAGTATCAKFDFQALPHYTCDAWVAKSSEKQASAEGMEKEARGYLGRPVGAYYDRSEGWLARFEGTPLYKEAVAMQEMEARLEADAARSRAERAMKNAEDAQFEIQVADIEANLARYKYETSGVSRSETMGKLAACAHDESKSWSDEFYGTPLFEQALKVAAESATREVARLQRDQEDDASYRAHDSIRLKAAELEAKLASWKLEQYSGTPKEAMALLRFTAGSGLPGTQVFTNMENAPRMRAGAMPADFWFYPLQGTPYYMGVPRRAQASLEKEQDQNKLKQMIAGPMRAEMMAARSNMPSPGQFILVVKSGSKFHYIKPEFNAALAAGGAGSQPGVDQELRKQSSAEHPGQSHEEAHPGQSHSAWEAAKSVGKGALKGLAGGAALGLAGGLGVGYATRGHDPRAKAFANLTHHQLNRLIEQGSSAGITGAGIGTVAGGLKGAYNAMKKGKEKKASVPFV